MEEPVLKSTQTENVDHGQLQINVTANVGLIPIQDASITISYTGEPNSTLETLTTDSSGQTDTVSLDAPPLEYSLTPNSPMPYSEYTLTVTAPGYEPVTVSGVEVLPDVTAMQNIEMIPTEMARDNLETIVIPDHTLYGDYPPKIPEDEIKPMDESGEIVLSRVVIPSNVKTLHLFFYLFSASSLPFPSKRLPAVKLLPQNTSSFVKLLQNAFLFRLFPQDFYMLLVID